VSYEQWVGLVASVGFPIAVSWYLLFRMERTLKELASTIQRLCDKLN